MPQAKSLRQSNDFEDRPAAVPGKVEVRPMMYVVLSYDHCIVDGSKAVTFLVRVKECVEDPARWRSI